jgi:Skp family chaperone for outer membrane proteins
MSCLLLRVRALSLGIALAAVAAAQGIETKSGAQILFGSSANCSKAATIDFDKVRKATPEWKTIKSEAVPGNSARYDLLIMEMNKRIKDACKEVAQGGGHDCVLAKGDLADAKGQKVADITDEVVRKLES